MSFLKNEIGGEDPFIRGATDEDKAALVSLFLMRQYGAGQRGEMAGGAEDALR